MKQIELPRMHMSLFVADINQTTSFYQKFFGIDPSKQKPGYVKFELANPGLIISFIQGENPKGHELGHLGIQVESMKALHEKKISLEGMLEMTEEHQTNCCYALQDKFWVSDPDGYKWEVYYFHEDVDQNDPEYAEEGACCAPTPLLNNEKEVACC